MGGRNSKSANSSINSDFCPLRIASIYVDLGESINKKKKIRAMVEYFMHDYYGYKIDVLCLQGIKSYKILKELIREFKTYMLDYNDKHAKIGQDVYLEYFPDIEITENKDEMNWSTSETEETDFYDKLIITRHEILSKATPALGVRDDGVHGYSYINTYPSQEFLKRGENIMYNRDSDSMYDGRRHIQVANLNINGTYVSIYNVELKSDVKGIRSSKERKAQIFDLKELINQNAENSKDDRVREFEYGDDKYVAHNRNLHIVTGMFHINEMRNDEFNPEYIRTVKVLDGLDTHRWIMAFRNRVNPEATNIKFSKDAYTMMISNPILDTSDLQGKARAIYQEYKTLITSSIIMRNSVDMSYFTNYPIDTLFMIYKPKIGYAENGITRPDHFIRQEVYTRLTKTEMSQKSKRGHVDDLDFKTLSIKHKEKGKRDRDTIREDSISRHGGRPPARRVSESSERSRTRERITRLVSSNKNMNRDNISAQHRSKKKSHDSQSSRNKKRTRNRSHNRSNRDVKKIDKSNSISAYVDKNKRDDESQTKIITKELSKDDMIKVHSAIDLMIDRYEPPGEKNSEHDRDDDVDPVYSTGDGDTNRLTHDSETHSSGSLSLSPLSSPRIHPTTTPPSNVISDIDGVELVDMSIQIHSDDYDVDVSIDSDNVRSKQSRSKHSKSKHSKSKSKSKHRRSKSISQDSQKSDSLQPEIQRSDGSQSTSPKSRHILNDSSGSMRSRESKESNPIIHHGKSLMNEDSIDIDTDSENDLANDEMLRIIDNE